MEIARNSQAGSETRDRGNDQAAPTQEQPEPGDEFSRIRQNAAGGAPIGGPRDGSGRAADKPVGKAEAWKFKPGPRFNPRRPP